MANYPDIGLELSGHVATIEIQRPPNNFFDVVLINSIADALHDLDKNDQCRAVVLAAQGKAFCAGANFGDGSTLNREGQRPGEAASPGRWPDLSSVEPSPKFAPAQNDLPCAASTTARHLSSWSNASSASAIELISTMSK